MSSQPPPDKILPIFNYLNFMPSDTQTSSGGGGITELPSTLSIGDGTVNSPSLTFTSEPSSGIYNTPEGVSISENGTNHTSFSTSIEYDYGDAFEIEGEVSYIDSSSDGRRIAIGDSKYINGTSAEVPDLQRFRGRVRVFDYNDVSGVWDIQVGQTLLGDFGQRYGWTSLGDEFGNTLSISDDGMFLFIGAQYADADATNVPSNADNGSVSFYRLNNGVWEFVQEFFGGIFKEASSRVIVNSMNGSRVIVGSPNYKTDNKTFGRTFVYDKNDQGEWDQTILYNDIVHSVFYGKGYGGDLAVSDDGKKIIVGSGRNSVLFYTFNDSTGSWEQGDEIKFIDIGVIVSVAMSGDGNVWVAGHSYVQSNVNNKFSTGICSIFDSTGLKTQTIRGNFFTDFFGIRVRMNKNADVLVINNVYSNVVFGFDYVSSTWVQYFKLDDIDGSSSSPYDNVVHLNKNAHLIAYRRTGNKTCIRKLIARNTPVVKTTSLNIGITNSKDNIDRINDVNTRLIFKTYEAIRLHHSETNPYGLTSTPNGETSISLYRRTYNDHCFIRYHTGDVNANDAFFTGLIVRRANEDQTNDFRITNASGTGVSLVSGATSWSSVSDRNKKKNLVELTDVLNRLQNIKGYKYNFIDEDTDIPNKYGVIAQDLKEQGFCEIINMCSEIDGDVMSVRYTEMIPLLIQSINELHEKVKALESQVQQLQTTQTSP